MQLPRTTRESPRVTDPATYLLEIQYLPFSVSSIAPRIVTVLTSPLKIPSVGIPCREPEMPDRLTAEPARNPETSNAVVAQNSLPLPARIIEVTKTTRVRYTGSLDGKQTPEIKNSDRKNSELLTTMNTFYSWSLHLSRGMPIFILDNFRSAFNTGSVFRTAEAIAPCGLFLTGITAKPPHRKLAHSARGTQNIVPWKYFITVIEACNWAVETGRKIIVLEASETAQESLWNASFSVSDAFILGNEALGVDEQVLSMADMHIYFPQSGYRKCMNVSSIAAILAAELQRRRKSHTPEEGCRPKALDFR